MMDSSTFKRFTANVYNILESLEDVDLTAMGEDQALHSFKFLKFLEMVN